MALVTGGAGFIGSHVVERLRKAGWRVRVIDDFSTGSRENLTSAAKSIEIIEGSVTDSTLLERACQGSDVVFHLAAKASVPESFKKPKEYERVNVFGTDCVLKAARNAGAKRVVFSSTCAVYGDARKLPINENAPTNPLSPYAVTKLAGEDRGRLLAGAGGPAFTVLRYFNVYGLRQNPRSAYSGVISRFVEALHQGEAPTIFGDGRQTRDFVHVRDVAEANWLAANADIGPFGVFNVGTGTETSILELLNLLARLEGRPVVPRWLPARQGEIARSVAEASGGAARLDFMARTKLRRGLMELLSGSAPRLDAK